MTTIFEFVRDNLSVPLGNAIANAATTPAGWAVAGAAVAAAVGIAVFRRIHR